MAMLLTLIEMGVVVESLLMTNNSSLLCSSIEEALYGRRTTMMHMNAPISPISSILLVVFIFLIFVVVAIFFVKVC